MFCGLPKRRKIRFCVWTYWTRGRGRSRPNLVSENFTQESFGLIFRFLIFTPLSSHWKLLHISSKNTFTILPTKETQVAKSRVLSGKGIAKCGSKGGVSVCLRLSAFACVFASAFACICQCLSAFVCVCSHLLMPPFVAPPLFVTLTGQV